MGSMRGSPGCRSLQGNKKTPCRAVTARHGVWRFHHLSRSPYSQRQERDHLLLNVGLLAAQRLVEAFRAARHDEAMIRFVAVLTDIQTFDLFLLLHSQTQRYLDRNPDDR